MNTVPLFLRLAPLALVLLALTSPARAAGAPEGAAMVGEATLVIGVAKLIASDGVERPVDRGTAIRVGDRIETGAGGHVHLRFVDGARLSVRPASRLQVENYSRAGDGSALTAIKFRLDEGVVRSITGAWGEAERDRFRLNTPVAAIGVKGTDFVVKSDGETTLASVYTGAIMLTPLGGVGCQASLGPCLNGSERLLSQDMKGQMLSLSRQQTTPQLVPAVDLLAQRVVRPAMAEAVPRPDVVAKIDPLQISNPVGSRAETTVEKTVVSESRAVDMVAVQVASAAQVVKPVQPVVPVQPIVPAQPVVPVQPVVPAEPIQPVQAVQLPPEVKQLMWARLVAVAADGDTISRSFAQTMQSGRQLVGGNGAFTLFREGTSTGLLSNAEASANFRLAGATASLVWSDRGSNVIEPARVDNGTLSVDFSRATYTTQLSVSNARFGADTVASNGVVTPTGMLQSVGGSAGSAGALSLDGKEAAYFFVKSIVAGQLNGITLWGR